MRTRPVIYAFICALLTVSSVALGQKSYALGFGGGAAIPVGKLSDTQKTGYNGLAMLAIGVSDQPFGLRFDGMYNLLSHVKGASGPAATGDVRVAAAIANLIFAFPGSSAKVYILAGGGLYNFKADTTGAKSQSNFGVSAGLGATFGFGPFATFLESKYHSISRNVAKGGVYQFVPITLGVMF